MKPIALQDAAKEDLAEAECWYQAKHRGLGDELLEEFLRTTALISERRESFRLVEGVARRAILHRFPYLVIFY